MCLADGARMNFVQDDLAHALHGRRDPGTVTSPGPRNPHIHNIVVVEQEGVAADLKVRVRTCRCE